MAEQIKKVDYDYENDIFSISNQDKVKASLDIGDFILDINHKNLICGIEIMDASENLGISKENLQNIKSIKISINYKTNNVYVLLMITLKKQERDINVQIPLTLNLGHKIPRQEILTYN